MFVVLVGGYEQQRDEFHRDVLNMDDEDIVWINNSRTFNYIADLFVNFGGIINIPKGKLVITWSGDNQETIQRVYKTLGLE
jgi:hypothetical protein